MFQCTWQPSKHLITGFIFGLTPASELCGLVRAAIPDFLPPFKVCMTLAQLPQLSRFALHLDDFLS